MLIFYLCFCPNPKTLNPAICIYLGFRVQDEDTGKGPSVYVKKLSHYTHLKYFGLGFKVYSPP